MIFLFVFIIFYAFMYMMCVNLFDLLLIINYYNYNYIINNFSLLEILFNLINNSNFLNLYVFLKINNFYFFFLFFFFIFFFKIFFLFNFFLFIYFYIYIYSIYIFFLLLKIFFFVNNYFLLYIIFINVIVIIISLLIFLLCVIYKIFCFFILLFFKYFIKLFNNFFLSKFLIFETQKILINFNIFSKDNSILNLFFIYPENYNKIININNKIIFKSFFFSFNKFVIFDYLTGKIFNNMKNNKSFFFLLNNLEILDIYNYGYVRLYNINELYKFYVFFRIRKLIKYNKLTELVTIKAFNSQIVKKINNEISFINKITSEKSLVINKFKLKKIMNKIKFNQQYMKNFTIKDLINEKLNRKTLKKKKYINLLKKKKNYKKIIRKKNLLNNLPLYNASMYHINATKKIRYKIENRKYKSIINNHFNYNFVSRINSTKIMRSFWFIYLCYQLLFIKQINELSRLDKLKLYLYYSFNIANKKFLNTDILNIYFNFFSYIWQTYKFDIYYENEQMKMDKEYQEKIEKAKKQYGDSIVEALIKTKDHKRSPISRMKMHIDDFDSFEIILEDKKKKK
jgi:hypothetical protein